MTWLWGDHTSTEASELGATGEWFQKIFVFVPHDSREQRDALTSRQHGPLGEGESHCPKGHRPGGRRGFTLPVSLSA